MDTQRGRAGRTTANRLLSCTFEGAGGGGPLMAAPATTGVIDTAIHNQRVAVLDIANGRLRQVSPADLHIYDYDWSPDDKTFVATAAAGARRQQLVDRSDLHDQHRRRQRHVRLQTLVSSRRSALVAGRQIDRLH